MKIKLSELKRIIREEIIYDDDIDEQELKRIENRIADELIKRMKTLLGEKAVQRLSGFILDCLINNDFKSLSGRNLIGSKDAEIAEDYNLVESIREKVEDWIDSHYRESDYDYVFGRDSEED